MPDPARRADPGLASPAEILIPVAPGLEFLINPLHPDVSKIAAVKVRKWTYDQRLV